MAGLPKGIDGVRSMASGLPRVFTKLRLELPSIARWNTAKADRAALGWDVFDMFLLDS